MWNVQTGQQNVFVCSECLESVVRWGPKAASSQNVGQSSVCLRDSLGGCGLWSASGWVWTVERVIYGPSVSSSSSSCLSLSRSERLCPRPCPRPLPGGRPAAWCRCWCRHWTEPGGKGLSAPSAAPGRSGCGGSACGALWFWERCPAGRIGSEYYRCCKSASSLCPHCSRWDQFALVRSPGCPQG